MKFLMLKEKVIVDQSRLRSWPLWLSVAALIAFVTKTYFGYEIPEFDTCYLRDGMKVLQQMGCAREEDWPYDISNFTSTPSVNSSKNALNYKIAAYHRVVSLVDLKTSLADGSPVVMGIEVYDSFESGQVEATGIVPLPKPSERCLGGHAVLAVGYKDDGKALAKGLVICRNSWGSCWGDKGYFYLPYSYFKRHVTDMWTGR